MDTAAGFFHRSQVTGHRSQVTGHRSQVTGHRSQVTGHNQNSKFRDVTITEIPEKFIDVSMQQTLTKNVLLYNFNEKNNNNKKKHHKTEAYKCVRSATIRALS